VNIHDIRRTVADALLNRIGAPPWIVDHVVLGHARPKLLRTYMSTLPLKEAREALQKWGEELDRILDVEVSAGGPDAAVSATRVPVRGNPLAAPRAPLCLNRSGRQVRLTASPEGMWFASATLAGGRRTLRGASCPSTRAAEGLRKNVLTPPDRGRIH
jgi:hypothetical protein